MEILGKDFAFSFTDVDDLARYEAAREKLAAVDIQTGTPVEIIRRECAGIRDFVTDLFGEGAYESLCSSPSDYKRNLEILFAVGDAYQAASAEMEKMQANMKKRLAKYTVGSRRT